MALRAAQEDEKLEVFGEGCPWREKSKRQAELDAAPRRVSARQAEAYPTSATLPAVFGDSQRVVGRALACP